MRFILIGFPEHLLNNIRMHIVESIQNAQIEIFPTYIDGMEVDDGVVVIYESPSTMPAIKRIVLQGSFREIVVLSSSPTEDSAIRYMDAGATDYRGVDSPSTIWAIYANKEKFQKKLRTEASNKKAELSFKTASPKLKKILDKLALVAKSKASILIAGESGVGKEQMAKYIHECSNRSKFLGINCAAIPETLIESELFGHKKGAFTGADKDKKGLFEAANGGTLLLDEITEMPIHLQPKLLRAIQEREITPVGSSVPVKIDVRIIATTNRNISKAISEGKFREDLYYRLSVVEVVIPPLRERPEDIELLSDYFLEKYSKEYELDKAIMTPSIISTLKSYRWPGNVRELDNVMHRASLMCSGIEIDHDSLELKQDEVEAIGVKPGMSIKDMEEALIKKTLESVNGNKTEAAKLLGITTKTLRNKLQSMA